MDKKRLLVIMLASVLLTDAHAAWRVVIDPWTAGQVAENTASQKLIEEQHNTRLDSISSKQQKIMQYTAAMETIKELYRISMQNITGFGEETKYYGEICQLTLSIMTDVPTVLEYIAKSPVKNYILCLNEMNNVVLETEGLVADFVDIVNNGKIHNPFKKATVITTCPRCGGNLKTIDTGSKDVPHVYVCQKCGWNTNKNVSTEENVGDGYNFLDRYERLTLANRIYSRLLEIHYKMEAMKYMCEYANGLSDVLFAIDPESWATWFTAKNMIDGIINDWNSLDV